LLKPKTLGSAQTRKLFEKSLTKNFIKESHAKTMRGFLKFNE